MNHVHFLLLQAGGAAPAELDPLQLVLDASFVVKLTLLTLVGMSVACWFIIGTKAVRIQQATRQSAKFLDAFWSKADGNKWSPERLETIYAQIGVLGGSPLARVFHAGYVWDDDAWLELTTLAVRRARDTGALNFLPLALTQRASVHVHAGEFELASALIEESDAITELTGNAPLKFASLLLVAWRGADPDAAALIQANTREAATWGEGRAIGQAEYLVALLCNGLGRYQDALASAERACEYDDLGVFGFALLELVEAAARAGAPEVASAALAHLAERTVASGTNWALGVLARSRALLTEGEAADALYREAIDRLGRTRVSLHLARAHLVYGEWLRRENRPRDAREHLRAAHDALRRCGAAAFAERTRRELVAAGEWVGHDSVGVREVLTAQEAQIARLASEGRTNPEIGAELFLSPRTVEWHLHKVFTKLNVDSRGKLRAALTPP